MMHSDHQQICFLGLGSNQGEKARNLQQAIKHISQLPNTTFIESAPWYISKPWGVTEQDEFLNTVIKIKTKLKPLALLKAIKKIEYSVMNRQVNKRWHSRNIDIDILLYAQQSINRPQLTIPHQHLTTRCFVVRPLLQLSPQLSTQLKQKITAHHKNHQCASELKTYKKTRKFNSRR